MKSFHSLVVVRRPRQQLWTIMRDHLSEIAAGIAEIEEVRQIERNVDADGVDHITNEWRARQQIPAAIRSLLKIDDIGWIDRNVWDGRTSTCSWSIEPKFLADHVICGGKTVFDDAMGGRGTRVTFEGTLELRPGLLGSLGSLEAMVSGFVESIVSTIIPRNLRAVVEAAALFEPPD